MKLSQLVKGVGHLGIAVSDMKKSIAFYEQKTGFKKEFGKVVVDANGKALDITMMKLGNLTLELFKPAAACPDKICPKGAWDHFAIEAPDFDSCVRQACNRSMVYDASTPDGPVYYDGIGSKGVLGVNFMGPDNEVIELCNNCAKNYADKTGLLGWSHLALKVACLDPVVAFYENFGFRICDDGYLETDNGTLKIVFMALGSFQLELIETGTEQPGHGVLRHLALEVSDAELALRLCKNNGINVQTPLPRELSLYEHGIRYIMLKGKAGEEIELFQKLKW